MMLNKPHVPILLFLLLSPIVEGISYSVPVSVNVNPVYNLSLNVGVLNERALAGENLNVSLELEKIGREGEIEVYLSYDIIKGKKTVLSGYIGSINVSDYKKEVVQIPMPTSMEPGRYRLNVTATHPQAYSDSDNDDFWIRGKHAWWQFWLWF